MSYRECVVPSHSLTKRREVSLTIPRLFLGKGSPLPIYHVTQFNLNDINQPDIQYEDTRDELFDKQDLIPPTGPDYDQHHSEGVDLEEICDAFLTLSQISAGKRCDALFSTLRAGK